MFFKPVKNRIDEMFYNVSDQQPKNMKWELAISTPVYKLWGAQDTTQDCLFMYYISSKSL